MGQDTVLFDISNVNPRTYFCSSVGRDKQGTYRHALVSKQPGKCVCSLKDKEAVAAIEDNALLDILFSFSNGGPCP